MERRFFGGGWGGEGGKGMGRGERWNGGGEWGREGGNRKGGGGKVFFPDRHYPYPYPLFPSPFPPNPHPLPLSPPSPPPFHPPNPFSFPENNFRGGLRSRENLAGKNDDGSWELWLGVACRRGSGGLEGELLWGGGGGVKSCGGEGRDGMY